MSNKTQAIKELAPNCEFGWSNDDYSTLWWSDDNGTAKPTEAEINAKATAMATRDAHIAPRKKAYPTIQEQLDMQYKDVLNSTTTWKDAIAKVKSDNPKSED